MNGSNAALNAALPKQFTEIAVVEPL